jgi:TonB-dependent starch-binding outer membrane protein SusC
MLNTRQYLQMRREAFKNDMAEPDMYSAPDLLVWDTTRYTNFKKDFTGNTAHTTDVQLSLSGGNSNTQFLIRGAHNDQSTVFPGDLHSKNSSVHINLHHRSADKNLAVQFSANYNSSQNKLPVTDYSSFISLPPDLPPLYDTAGNLNWEMGGIPFDNPMAYLQQRYVSSTDNLLGNLQLSYRIAKGLTTKINLGYNTMLVDETSALPKAAQDPKNLPTGSAVFGTNRFKSWVIEPQLEYIHPIGKGTLTLLLGGTGQQLWNNRTTIQATGYNNDAMLGSVDGAARTVIATIHSEYKYAAVFGRLNYNWKDRYIVNLTGRRDGSSRFGPERRYANFFAGGIAWIFSDEAFIKEHGAWLSYGKIRASYGTTGNDQIGDYRYLDVWTSQTYRYQGPSLAPTRLYNPDYSWEVNKKFELGTDLGFLQDKILLSAAYFINRSSNQLVEYRLPGQTGFGSIIKNFPAVVENRGLELSISTKNISGKNFTWTTSANITLPKNKLLSFPGIATSGYYKVYETGKSLNTFYGLHLLGVDPVTGVYQFEDVNKDGGISLEDYTAGHNLDPRYYGGISNTLSYKNWDLNFLVEFKKQLGYNYNNYPVYNFTPGAMYNLPAVFLDRWQQTGDYKPVQQFTQTFTPAFDGQYYFTLSDGRLSDASYLRLKNISLSYRLTEQALKKIAAKELRLYLMAQNAWTVTSYKGGDPEIQNLFILPPLRTFVAGIQITF